MPNFAYRPRSKTGLCAWCGVVCRAMPCPRTHTHTHTQAGDVGQPANDDMQRASGAAGAVEKDVLFVVGIVAAAHGSDRLTSTAWATPWAAHVFY